MGVFGICGDGDYAFCAAMTGYRLKCCVGIPPINYDHLNCETFGGFDPVGALEKIAKQRTAEAQGGK